MNVTTSCSECKARMADGILEHVKGCSASVIKMYLGIDYLRHPGTLISFDTPKEAAEWLSKLTGSRANAKPKRKLAQIPPKDESVKGARDMLANKMFVWDYKDLSDTGQAQVDSVLANLQVHISTIITDNREEPVNVMVKMEHEMQLKRLQEWIDDK